MAVYMQFGGPVCGSPCTKRLCGIRAPEFGNLSQYVIKEPEY